MNSKIKNILLIDDDIVTNKLHKFIFDQLNFADNIEVVRNGQLALEYLTCTGNYEKETPDYPKPDLIFVDINMPVMDGFRFLNHYNNLPLEQRSNSIIIMLSTSLLNSEKKRAESQKNINEFVNKPITPEILDNLYNKYFA